MIDVVLPAYNAERYVELAVRSVLTQTFTDFRLFVVDDGSTDGTNAIVRRLAETDNRIILLEKSNSGIVDTLNLGLAHCTAEFIARMDADDICYPNRFAEQLAYLTANPDCAVVGGNVIKIDSAGNFYDRTFGGGDFHPNWEEIPAREAYIIHPFLMARRSAFDAVGGYRYYFNCEDSDLYWRLYKVGRLHNMSTVLGEYRHHTQSVTNGSAVSSRIGAVTAQLAALSARRRDMGREDLVMGPETTAAFRKAAEFDKIIELASEQLDESERAYLRIAAAAKLIELKHYRQFRLSSRDIRTIMSAIRAGWPLLSKRDRKVLKGSIILWLRPKLGLKTKWRRIVQKFDRVDNGTAKTGLGASAEMR